jgi:hypothetical protein
MEIGTDCCSSFFSIILGERSGVEGAIVANLKHLFAVSHKFIDSGKIIFPRGTAIVRF